LVEFALVAPVLVLLVFGLLEYGRMVMVQQVLTNATREGARMGVLDGATASEVTTFVEDYLEGASIDGGDVTIDPPEPSDAAFGEPVTVTVDVPFDQVTWLPSPMYLHGQTLSASTSMRRESAQ